MVDSLINLDADAHKIFYATYSYPEVGSGPFFLPSSVPVLGNIGPLVQFKKRTKYRFGPQSFQFICIVE